MRTIDRKMNPAQYYSVRFVLVSQLGFRRVGEAESACSKDKDSRGGDKNFISLAGETHADPQRECGSVPLFLKIGDEK